MLMLVPIAFYVLDNDATYFDSFGVEHVSKEIKRFIDTKHIKTNIFKIQAYNSEICGYFYTGFIGYMFARKTLIGYISLFSPY